MTTPDPLFATLVARRKALHLTQTAVAGQLGVARENLSRWERGHVEPRLGVLVAYARIVGLRVAVAPLPPDAEMEGAVAS